MNETFLIFLPLPPICWDYGVHRCGCLCDCLDPCFFACFSFLLLISKISCKMRIKNYFVLASVFVFLLVFGSTSPQRQHAGSSKTAVCFFLSLPSSSFCFDVEMKPRAYCIQSTCCSTKLPHTQCDSAFPVCAMHSLDTVRVHTHLFACHIH